MHFLSLRRQARQQFLHGDVQNRMDPVGSDLHQRNQNKAAFRNSGVGDGQPGPGQVLLAEKQDVQVQCAWPPPFLSDSPQALLNLQGDGEQRLGCHIDLTDHNPVNEPVLVCESKRFAPVECGYLLQADLRVPAESLKGLPAGADPVPQITPETDECLFAQTTAPFLAVPSALAALLSGTQYRSIEDRVRNRLAKSQNL